MNMKELAAIVVEKAGVDISSKDAAILFGAGFDAILSSVKKREKVSIHNFASFEGIVKRARTGRNPSNGESVQIPARIGLKFKLMPAVAKELKELKVKVAKEAKETVKKTDKPAAKAAEKKTVAKPAAKPVAAKAPVAKKRR